MTFTPRRAVLTLGVTQTIGYACSSYLPATLAKPMAADVGMSTTGVFLAFSAALLLQAVTGPRVGKLVDQRGGRPPQTPCRSATRRLRATPRRWC